MEAEEELDRALADDNAHLLEELGEPLDVEAGLAAILDRPQTS